MTQRFRALASAALLFSACGEDERPPPNVGSPDAGEGGDSGATSGTGATSGKSGKGGSSGNAGGVSGAAGADDGGDGGSGTSGKGGSSGASGSSGAGGEAGMDGTGGTGGSVEPCPSDTAGAPPMGLTALCDPAANWGMGAFVFSNGSMDDQLIAVTPDELTIAWYSAIGAAGAYLVADRSSASSEFDTPQTLSVSNVVALSPDGLRLAALSDLRDEFVELTRSTRADTFGTPTAGDFSLINAAVGASSDLLGGGVMSPDDRTFFYTLLADQGVEYPLFVSTRSGSEPWPVGDAIEACEFRAQGALTRLPTGVSSDGLTLFYYDSARGTSRAAWRLDETSPFVWFRDLGEISRAQPNTACGRLYYSAFAASSGIFVAPAE